MKREIIIFFSFMSLCSCKQSIKVQKTKIEKKKCSYSI